MRKRGTIAVLLLAVGLLVWWAMPSPASEEEQVETARKEAVRRLFQTGTGQSEIPDLVERLEETLARCERCAAGELSGPVCEVCTVDEPPPEPEMPAMVALVVDVVNEDGRPEERARVRVYGCPVFGRQGNVYQVKPGVRCEVSAVRQEGLLQVPSASEHVAAGREGAYVQLQLPRARVGGLGIQFRKRGGVVVVERVMPGTPAEAFGLEPGDRILAVDGVPTRELGAQDFVRTMTGPVGSEVTFTLQATDEEGVFEEELKLRRSFLEGS